MEDPPAVEVERKELRDGREHRQGREAPPVDRLHLLGREQDPERRRRNDRRPVKPRCRSQGSDRPPPQPRRPPAGLDRRCAHGSSGMRSTAVAATPWAATSCRSWWPVTAAEAPEIILRFTLSPPTEERGRTH